MRIRFAFVALIALLVGVLAGPAALAQDAESEATVDPTLMLVDAGENPGFVVRTAEQPSQVEVVVNGLDVESGTPRTLSSAGIDVQTVIVIDNGAEAAALLPSFVDAAVIGLFESVIAKVTVLAVFLPVVAGQGGNAGAQSLAVVMRGLVMREIPPHKVGRLVLKEGFLGALNGVLIGSVTAAVAWVWKGNPYLGLVIGLAMIVNLIVAGLAGALIPLSMKAMGWDPAQSSSILLTTVTDVVGFFTFLGFAVLFQQYLI